jgi:hypothetical protein
MELTGQMRNANHLNNVKLHYDNNEQKAVQKTTAIF